jgi:hypothetical protein
MCWKPQDENQLEREAKPSGVTRSADPYNLGMITRRSFLTAAASVRSYSDAT